MQKSDKKYTYVDKIKTYLDPKETLTIAFKILPQM